MNEDIVIVPMIISMLSWIAWVIFSTIRRYKIAKLQAEVQTRLLDKFGSGQELLAYVQTDTGKRFLDSLVAEQRTPYGRILGAAQTSVILLLLGAALMFLRGRVSEAEQGFLVLGTLILALGIGFALSAAVSYVLSKSFGLLTEASAHRH